MQLFIFLVTEIYWTWSLLNDIPTYFGLIFIFVEKHLQCDNKSSARHYFHAFAVDLQSVVECLSNRKRLYVIVGGVGSTSVRSSVEQYFKPLQVESDQLQLWLLFDILSVFWIPSAPQMSWNGKLRCPPPPFLCLRAWFMERKLEPLQHFYYYCSFKANATIDFCMIDVLY